MAERSSNTGGVDSRRNRLDRPLTTQEAVVRALRESIATGELRPGERLYQDAIAEQMGVSRVPVREALNVLRADGQLEYTPHRGYWVSALSRESVEEIKLIRGLLENEAIKLAVPKLDDELVQRMETLNDAMIEAHDTDDVSRFAHLNHEFHFALFDRAEKPRLSQHIDVLWKSADIYRMSIFTDHDDRDHMLAEHADLIEACRARDLEGALEVMEKHRNKAVDTLTNLVNDGPEAPHSPENDAAGAGSDPRD
jgi:DNA-binding GntR family transcriptional regulator